MLVDNNLVVQGSYMQETFALLALKGALTAG